MPPGYRLESGGIDEEAGKGERQNSTSLAITVVLIFLCLIIQYNSFVKPLMKRFRRESNAPAILACSASGRSR